MAVRERNPLPAELIETIQRIVLDWKHTVHLTPFERVEDKHGLKTLIATSGLVKEVAEHDAMLEQSGPCLSFAPVTEVSESLPVDYSQAMHYVSAPNSEDERYQSKSLRQPSLEIDEERDSSPDPLVDIDVESSVSNKVESLNSDKEGPMHSFKGTLSERGPETPDSSTREPNLDPVSEDGITSPISKSAFPQKPQRSDNGSDGSIRQVKR